MKKAKPISVRLNAEAYKRCEDAEKLGYSKTAFIENAILNTACPDRSVDQRLLIHFCKMQTIIEPMKKSERKDLLREELNKVCQLLKSQKETI